MRIEPIDAHAKRGTMGSRGRTRRAGKRPGSTGIGSAELDHAGFSLSIEFACDVAEAVLEELHYEVLAPTSLECAGGRRRRAFRGFVTRWRGSATEEDRRAIAKWLSAKRDVKSHEVGALTRAWYGV